jgi:hypothetical protein
MKRSRGRNRRSGGNNQNNFNNPNRHFESVGPDVKIRGSAQQVLEKYQQYARDAQTSGDRILSEAYYQFAEHYQRIVAKQQEARDRQQQQRGGGRDDRDQNRRDNSRNDGDDNPGESGKDEAEKTEASVERRDATSKADDSSDDAMRVIDEDSSSDECPARLRMTTRRTKSRSRRRKSPRRKTYKSGENEASDDSDPSDGVLKTVSRGRRKAKDEEAETSAETTD